jgi:diguanylate cyclase (GGDEF)-like protein
MGSQRASTTRLWRATARLKRPTGLVERSRWLFWLCTLGSMAVTLPAALGKADAVDRSVIGLASVALCLVWTTRYLLGRAPLALDVLDAVALTSFAVMCPSPMMVFTFAFPAFWYRSLYSSNARVTLHCVGTAFAVVTAGLLWSSVHGPTGATAMVAIVGNIPVMAVTVAVARYLALSLIAREHEQLRDGALAVLGSQLLDIAGPGHILDRAAEAATTICTDTPELRVLLVGADGGELRVLRRVGVLDEVPDTLPLSWLPVDGVSGQLLPLADEAGLHVLVPSAASWSCFVVSPLVGLWMIVGAPKQLPTPLAMTLQSLTNQVALAMRNSAAHRDLTVQALTDSLTGLANRAAFTRELEQAVAERSAELTVLFLDLDDFKLINDGLGHAAGDELLCQVGRRLTAGVRPGDVCARLGGDEFAVLLDGDDQEAAAVAQRLVDAVAQPVTLNGQVAQISVSVGLARASAQLSVAQVLQHADTAMYVAKAQGKNRVQAFESTLLAPDPTAVWEAQLAESASAGQLVVHYQPIVGVPDADCTGVEALVRWQHPTRGLLAAEEFIADAVRVGAIVEIGTFVLRRACADAERWRNDGDLLSVHVNVTATELADPGFTDAVRRCLVDFAMAPKQLVLEVTESMFSDSPAARASLDSVVAIGVAVAIDNFGTGNSSLTTLRTLPLDIVKIDGSFVAGVPALAADRAVVEAIVQMARRLGLRTIAEGVERADQRRYLEEVGVDAAQGYLLKSPVPAVELAAWLTSQKPPSVTHNVVALASPRRVG